ncbi:MAG: hypothetical protein OES26_04815, partial [Gammaproteobacteria bacterium]|nr:hypothetical protein [Gammaproteobacteria bacterium]
MPIPTICKMEKLSLNSLMAHRLIRAVANQDQDQGPLFANYLRNYSRLVDKAVREHNSAHSSILADANSQHTGSIDWFRTIDYLENCI